MFELIQAVYQQYFGSPTYNICILGINQTGKTLLFNSIKHMHEPPTPEPTPDDATLFQYKPTVGLNVVKYHHEKDQFMIWDLGGRQNIRKIWQSYYPECHGIIYILNSNLQEGLDVLKTVLTHQEMARIPLNIIVTDPTKKENVEATLSKSEWMQGHKYMVHALETSKFKNSKSVLQHLLHWLYFAIQQLHAQLKQ